MFESKKFHLASVWLKVIGQKQRFSHPKMVDLKACWFELNHSTLWRYIRLCADVLCCVLSNDPFPVLEGSLELAFWREVLWCWGSLFCVDRKLFLILCSHWFTNVCAHEKCIIVIDLSNLSKTGGMQTCSIVCPQHYIETAKDFRTKIKVRD